MREKLFTLMTLLLCAVGSAWANYSAVSADGKITLTWDFAEFNSPNNKSITTGESVSYEGITMFGGGGSNAETVDKNGFRFQGTTQQWSSVWGRYIVFTPAYNGTIKVYGKAGGTSGTRNLILSKALKTPSTTLDVDIVAASGALSTTVGLAFTYASMVAGTTYYIESNSGVYVSKIEFIFDLVAATTPGFDPDGGAINGGDIINLTGTALNTYYQWKDAATTLTPSSDGWIAGNSMVAPNENATGKYLYAYASNGTGYESSVVSQTFDITWATPTVTAPTITAGGYFTSDSKSVTITKTDDASTLKYSTDGGETWQNYTVALSITATTTVMAKAVRDGYTDSDIVSATYIKQDGGTSGTVEDLVAVSAGYTFIAEEISPSANTLYDSNRVFTTKKNTTKTDKGETAIDGVNHKNYLRLRLNNGGTYYNENLVFKASGPCVLTVYSQSVSDDKFHVGSTAAGTDYASTRAITSSSSSWSCIIPQAGLVYITGNATNDFCIAGFKLTALPTFQLNANGYATFSYSQPVEIVSGAKAYQATLNTSTNTITCTEITSGKIPAGDGVLLYGEANADIVVKTAFGDVDAVEGNDLKATTKADGTLAAKANEKFYYALDGDTFKKFTGATFVANKAFFESNTDLTISAPAFTLVFDDGNTTAIDAVKTTLVEDGIYYNIAGQRVAQPTKGLYIVNGKKVIVR